MPQFRNRPVDLVVDVRSKVEFFLGHLDGAVNIPVDRIAEALPARPDVPKHAHILVYCASGGRSAQAAAILNQLGYSRVVDGGGLHDARQHYAAARA